MNIKLTKYLIIAESLLFIPFVVSIISNEFKWTAFDFIVAAILLGLGALAAYMLFDKEHTNRKNQAAGIFLIILVVMAWIELAVGLLGSPFAGS